MGSFPEKLSRIGLDGRQPNKLLYAFRLKSKNHPFLKVTKRSVIKSTTVKEVKNCIYPWLSGKINCLLPFVFF